MGWRDHVVSRDDMSRRYDIQKKLDLGSGILNCDRLPGCTEIDVTQLYYNPITLEPLILLLFAISCRT
jgi:hypothetical protein